MHEILLWWASGGTTFVNGVETESNNKEDANDEVGVDSCDEVDRDACDRDADLDPDKIDEFDDSVDDLDKIGVDAGQQYANELHANELQAFDVGVDEMIESIGS